MQTRPIPWYLIAFPYVCRDPTNEPRANIERVLKNRTLQTPKTIRIRVDTKAMTIMKLMLILRLFVLE